MKVVIVDDEWYGLDVTYRLLTQIRMDIEVVACFRNPLEALEKIPHLNPHLVILDIEMPEMNGLEMYERLKELPVRFLMITAHSHAYLRASKLNPDVGVLAKPFCKADMTTMLSAMQI
jgi:YesN/AraC family two-component response regulator